MNELLKYLTEQAVSGIEHGFFDLAMSGEIKNGKRHIIIKGGKNQKFTLTEDEIQQWKEANQNS